MIVAEDVSFSYHIPSGNEVPTLRGLSLEIGDSGSLAVIGPNGSGKSTLARCLNGLIVPRSGRILVDGLDTADPENKWPVHQRAGMIFQNPDNQLVSTTVEREVAFGLENLGLPSPEIHDRVTWTLSRFNLEKYRQYPPHRLSGGEKQRLAIAAVASMRPRYLICDEPTSSLDPGDRRDILDLLLSIVEEYRLSVVFITQSPEEAVRMDRIALVVDGDIAAEGTPEEVYRESSRLAAHGLDVPLAKRLADALRTRGVAVPAGIVQPKPLVQWLAGRINESPRASESLKALDAPPGRRQDVTPPSDIRSVSSAPNAKPALSPTTPPIIAFDRVCHTYSPGTSLEIPALRDVTTRVFPGECVALTGPNGSGKSTMIQHLNRLLKADSGTVRVEGEDVSSPETDLRNLRQRVGLVFQFPEAQLFEETVFDDVAFGPRQTGVTASEIPGMVNGALERVGLDPGRFSHRHPLSLSGGEKRRAAIAGILAMDPSVLALDEPTSGLDSQSVRQVEAIFRTCKAKGTTLFLITHDMDLISRLADRILVMENGGIAVDTTPVRLFGRADGVDVRPRGRKGQPVRSGRPGWVERGDARSGRPGLCDLLTAACEAGIPVDPACFDLEEAADMIRVCVFDDHHASPGESHPC
ncbi:MAG: ATP-binding cassette domain-containing protein [Gemmatimonadetes bacterium]|nr:ATP-binding cassette domain-containing protein [Gemmatimonadota bacterium]MYD27213.1 ATP-binding cassette domain-containing protein [Gemmatimonadota bacterium]MYI98731.1 ATP-binding cassette domain-containing protein [Gemmatimonadota bacterium]